MLSCGSQLMSKLRLEMYRRHSISNIARITNSTWIEGGNNFSKNMLYRNCLQKSEEVCKNHKSNKKFPWNNQKNHPDKYRKNKKVSKSFDL